MSRMYLDKPTKWAGLALCLSPFFFIAIPAYIWVQVEKSRKKAQEETTE